MFQLCARALAWLAEGRPVLLARVVETVGFSSRDRAAAVAYSPGQPLAGVLFSHAADRELLALLDRFAEDGLYWLTVSEADAAAAGLSCGGRARLLIQRWDAALWQELSPGRPRCLVTELAGGTVGETWWYQGGSASDRLAEFGRLVRQGVSQTVLLREPDQVVSVLWPQVTVQVVGDGQIADALAANAALLGWRVNVVEELPAELGRADLVVVLSHDLELSGRALQAALAAEVGYLGALGSRHTQAARAGWLTGHGASADQLARIHGPAGLPIGSRTPAEIALSILAEMVQVRAS
jgi:xanthine dehydrogenase accessory factor